MSDKKIDPYHLGNSFIFPPEFSLDVNIIHHLGWEDKAVPQVMNDIHIEAEVAVPAMVAPRASAVFAS